MPAIGAMPWLCVAPVTGVATAPTDVLGVTVAGVTGAGVGGTGVTGAGATGTGATGAGVTGAGVTGAGATGAGATGAGVAATVALWPDELSLELPDTPEFPNFPRGKRMPASTSGSAAN